MLRPQMTSPFKRLLSMELPKPFDNAAYVCHLLKEAPSTTVEITKEEALNMFRQMDLIRKTENHMADLYRKKLIRGFCHLYVGQEACAVGIKSVMREQDTVITSYRCHAWYLLMANEDLVGLIGELLGKVKGNVRGKGGSMHMYAKNFFGGNGIVGSHIPLGTGVGLKHKYMNDKAVSITCYGDGACNQGQVFESYNIAKLLNLPVMYVVENNKFGMGTSSDRSSACTDYFKCCSYIPGIRLDGMDVLAVKAATKFALDYILAGNGPIIVELMTYRYFGHSLSDPGTSYRSRDDIKKVRDERDPLSFMKSKMIAAELATEAELKSIESKHKKMVEEVSAKCISDKEASIEELTSDIYKQNTMDIKMPGPLRSTPHRNIASY